MDTVVVITQEPVFTKTSVEEVDAGVVLDHSTMDRGKVNLNTVLDDNSIQGEAEVAEVVNGSGNKETEQENEEVLKTICVVEDSKIVKEKASETGTKEQGTVFVDEPKNTEDAKIILADVTLEKEKEDDTTQKPEEVSVEKPVTEEGQTETKNSQEEEKDISKASEEIPIKTDEVKEEKDSRTVETSVHGPEDENNETVSLEEITRKGDNIVKETALEQETPTQDVETKERVFVEAEKDETETVNTVVKDTEIVNNEETTVHDLKENADAVEAIKNSDEAEQVKCEVTGDKEKEEDIIHKAQEGEDIESKALKDIEEHEQVLVRDISQDEILVPEGENLNTSTVKESAILKTKSDETDAEPSLDLNEVEDTVTPSDELEETSKVVIEPPKPLPDQISKYTEEDEHVLGKNMSQSEAESLVSKEDREQEDKEHEKTENLEGPIELALKVDREELMDEKREACQVSMERGLALNESEAEETPVRKHLDVESGEQMEKPSLDESPSKEEEEESPNQEGQEEGSYGSETVPVPESIDLKERILDLAPLQEEESFLPIEKDAEVKSDEVKQVSFASPEGETTFEDKKIEVIKANEEEEQVADKIQSILETVDTEPVKSNEEPTVHESISLKDDSEPVEVIKNSDDAEQEATGDREKKEDIIHKVQEVQESLTVVEMPTIQGEDIELKASKDIEEHEHEHVVLVRDIPQEETLIPKAETVNTATGNESAEPSLGLKEKEETLKTVTPSDEVQESITLMERPKLSPEQISKDTEEDEHVSGSIVPQDEIFVTDAESLVTKEDKEAIMDLKEEEKVEEAPSDLALKVDKEEVMDDEKEEDEVAGGQNMEKGVELNESEVELVDQNITNETEENLVGKPSLESPLEETSKTLDEKIQEKPPEEEVAPHQEGKEKISVPESSEVEENSQEERSLDLPPLQEERKEKTHKHEQENEEVKSDEVTQVSSASPEAETVFEAEKLKEIKANEEEEEQVVADKIQSIHETVETVDTELAKSNEDDIAERLNSAGDEIQIKSKDRENVQIDVTDEVNEEQSAETSVNETEDEHNPTVSVDVISNISETIVHETANEEVKSEEIIQVSSASQEGETVVEATKKNESTVHETDSEEIKNLDEAEQNSDEVTGDREKEEDIITRKTTEELQESQNLLIQEENTESESSKDTMEHVHVLVRDVPQIDTLVTEAEDVNTSTVHKFESNEAEVGQERRKDIEPSFDLKEDKEKEETETVITSDEVRPCDQVDDDVQTEESVEIKSKETLQVESAEEKHENVIDVPSEELQPETVIVSQDRTEDIPSELLLKEELQEDKTEVDDGTQVMGEHQELNDTVAEKIDQTKTDEKVVVESVEKSASLECPSEEKSTTVGEKMEEEETLSVPQGKDEVTALQQEQIEDEYEATNDQQSPPVEEKSDQVSSEEHEGVIIVDAVKLEEEQVAEKIKNSLEPLETQSLLPSYSEEQEGQTVSGKIEDEKVKEEEPIVQLLSEKNAIKSHVTEAEGKKGDEETDVGDKKQGETIVNEADISTAQETAVLNTSETKINKPEETETIILCDEVRIQSTYISDESQGREESVEVKKDAGLVDLPSEKMSPSEETSKTVDGKIEEEVTLHQESEETVPVLESSGLGVEAKEEEESCPLNEQKNETKEEEDSTSAHQTPPVEEKCDQVSSATLSEEREDLTENEKETVEASRPDGTRSSNLVEEEKHKETLEEVPSSETIPQETLSDVMAVHLKSEDIETTTIESHEGQETVAQTRDIGTSLIDQIQPEESPRDEEEEKVISEEEEGEAQTRELEEEHMVDSSKKYDYETLIAETKKEDEEEKTVGLDASKTSENECTKQQEFENLEAPQLNESSQEVLEETGDESPSFITELEDQIPKKIKEEIKESQVVVDQTSSLVEEIHQEEEETKEPQKVEALSDQDLPVEASDAHQTLSSDKTPKQVEEIHQEEEILPTESDPVKSFSDCAGEEGDVSAEKEESLGETKPKESEAERKETSDDQIETSPDVRKVEDDDDDFSFSKSIGDENSSTLPVVGILKELQTTLEEKERGINEPETLEKNLVVEETPTSEIIEANMLQDSISRELEVNVKEKLQEETPADLSLTQVLPGEKILIPSKQEEEDVNASTSEKISLQEEEHPIDFEIEHNAEAQETVKEEDQTSDIKDDNKNEELQNEKLTTLSATRETDESFSPQVEEDATELVVGHDAKEQETHNVFGNDQEIGTSEKQITEPLSVTEKETTEEHVKSQAVSDDTNEINKTQETVDALITSEQVQLQDQSKDFGQEKQSKDLRYVQEDLDDEIKDDGHDSGLPHKKDSDLIEEKEEVDYVKTEPEDSVKHEEKNMCEQIGQEATKEIYQEECKQTDTTTAIKEEIKEEKKESKEDNLNSTKNTDDEIKDYGLDSVVVQKEESGSMEEKKEVENNMSGKIYEEECKQIDTVTAINEEKKETPESCLNTDDAIEKTKPEIKEIEKLSPVSETQDKPLKQEDEVPNQQKWEIADDVPKVTEEVQQKDETEEIVKEPSRKSLPDLIQKVEVKDKTEVATTEPRIEEEAKEEEDGDEHKDDKTSPDSIVMVEAKDTVSIIKTHKKSQGILSGVGSKVKHSISKVKKALTGKSSHTTKPSSPQ